MFEAHVESASLEIFSHVIYPNAPDKCQGSSDHFVPMISYSIRHHLNFCLHESKTVVYKTRQFFSVIPFHSNSTSEFRKFCKNVYVNVKRHKRHMLYLIILHEDQSRYFIRSRRFIAVFTNARRVLSAF
jgi:hypothetical protein